MTSSHNLSSAPPSGCGVIMCEVARTDGRTCCGILNCGKIASLLRAAIGELSFRPPLRPIGNVSGCVRAACKPQRRVLSHPRREEARLAEETLNNVLRERMLRTCRYSCTRCHTRAAARSSDRFCMDRPIARGAAVRPPRAGPGLLLLQRTRRTAPPRVTLNVATVRS